ncbi:MAG: hypothetical protein INR73_06965 [Williamsia sp.]|nr:hypothetical protein [Williamsia sp.]
MEYKNNISKFVAGFTILSIVSCSGLPGEDTIKKVIYTKEEGRSKEELNFITINPCGSGATLKIPKSFTLITVLSNSEISEKRFENVKKAKEILDNLSIDNIILMDKINDETFTNAMDELIKKEVYNIKLTERANTFIVGQTGDDYLLSMYDLNQINIDKTTKIADDTLDIKYHLAYTLVYKAIEKICPRENNYDGPNINNSSTVRLIKKKGEWVSN